MLLVLLEFGLAPPMRLLNMLLKPARARQHKFFSREFQAIY